MTSPVATISPTLPSPFLVFEGLDGSGKSTLMHGIVSELKSRSKSAVVTREPGGTPLAEEVRRLLLKTEGESPVAATELLLYAASRALHVAEVIKPALARGEWVLCDRFIASSVAFQCFARGLARTDTDWLNRFAQQGCQPDLTLLLDITVEESQRRQSNRSSTTGQIADRMERESQKFHERVRQGYRAQAQEDPAHWLVLDATHSPDNLHKQVLQELMRRQWLL